MKRNMLIAGAAFLVSATLANAQQKQIVSYYARGNSFGTGGEGLNVIASVPEGFVLTDLYASRETTGGIDSIILTTAQKGAVTQIWEQRVGPVLAYETHFQSGLRVPAGLILAAGFEGIPFNDVAVTVSGYIETPVVAGNAPAVGEWGLVVLGMLVLTGGTLALVRQRRIA